MIDNNLFQPPSRSPLSDARNGRSCVGLNAEGAFRSFVGLPVVYLLRVAGHYKVGISRNFNRRIEEYRAHAYAVDVLGVWVVLHDLAFAERIVVARLSRWSAPLRKEWFNLPPRVVDYLCGIKDLDPVLAAWRKKVLVCAA